jgi:hypothetical protein
VTALPEVLPLPAAPADSPDLDGPVAIVHPQPEVMPVRAPAP